MRKLLLYLFGITTMGIGIGFILLAKVGYGPWDIFYANLVDLFDSSFTVMQAIISFLLVVSGFIIRKKRFDRSILIITINSAYLAVWIDLMLRLNSPENKLIGFIMLFGGLLMVAVGVNITIYTRLVLPALDYFIKSITDRTRFTYGRIKQFIEIAVLILGLSLGWIFDLSMKIGLGTLIIMFFGGYFVDLTHNLVIKILSRNDK